MSQDHSRYCSACFLVRSLWKDFIKGDIALRAMSLVYITLLSLVPLLALSFSVLKAFGVHNQLQPILLQVLEPLGQKGVEISAKIIDFVSNVNVGVLGAVGLVVLVYTSIALINKIEEALNFTWEVTTSRNFVNRLRHYLSLIFLGPILIFTAISLWISLLNNSWVQAAFSIDSIGLIFGFFTLHLSKLLSVIAFTIIYLLMPNAHVKPKVAFIGALIAAFLWHLTGSLFATFIVNSSTQTAIYSAFASLLVFMLWMYASWFILLFSARIAFYIQHPQHSRYSHHTNALNPALMEMIALSISQHITQQAYQKKPALSLHDLSQRLNIPNHFIQNTLEVLETHQLITKDAQHPPCYILSTPAETTTINAIKKAVAYGNYDQMTLMHNILEGTPSLNSLNETLQSGVQHNSISLKHFSLKSFHSTDI